MNVFLKWYKILRRQTFSYPTTKPCQRPGCFRQNQSTQKYFRGRRVRRYCKWCDIPDDVTTFLSQEAVQALQTAAKDFPAQVPKKCPSPFGQYHLSYDDAKLEIAPRLTYGFLHTLKDCIEFLSHNVDASEAIVIYQRLCKIAGARPEQITLREYPDD